MQIAAVSTALPPHFYDQETLVERLEVEWAKKHHNADRLRRLHENVLVGGRHLALPLERYDELLTFGQTNDAWIESALDLGAVAVERALEEAGLQVGEVDHLFFVTVTGVATPSIEARLINRLGLNVHTKRTPIFGLGCVAGAAGVARAADYVRAFPGHTAVLLSVELCSLTLQREDLSIANLIASGLFGDGAAAVVLRNQDAAGGPEVIATRSVFYPDTESVMGWEVSETGFGVVLSADVPNMVSNNLRADVDRFLEDHGLRRGDIASWVCHPGGPKVLEAMEQALELVDGELDLTWKSLREVGNLSSTSVLMVLRETLKRQRPPAGRPGMLLAMGPGFCSELVLLRW